MKNKLKLNLGCGKDFLKGYVNVDFHIPAEYRENFQFKESDVRSLPWVKTRSVDEIYAAFVLEHLHPDEITGVLFEWNRVLKMHGKLIFCVPDFNVIIDEYQKIKGKLFLSSSEYMFKKIAYVTLNPVISSSHWEGSGCAHKSLWTREWIQVILPTEGFRVNNFKNFGNNNFKLRVIAEKIGED